MQVRGLGPKKAFRIRELRQLTDSTLKDALRIAWRILWYGPLHIANKVAIIPTRMSR
jgi:hypothetical protein